MTNGTAASDLTFGKREWKCLTAVVISQVLCKSYTPNVAEQCIELTNAEKKRHYSQLSSLCMYLIETKIEGYLGTIGVSLNPKLK